MARKNSCGQFKKSVNFELYNWCPGPKNFNKSLNGSRANKVQTPSPYFCTATAGSQGIDFINGYVYTVILINDKPSRLAYVECDYVS